MVIHSQGLVPGQPHAQHIHGSAHGGHFGCPTLKENDTDGDGVLTNEEATGEYGTIFLALTTRGGATPQDGLAVDRMPVADSKGRLDYERTFPAEVVPDGLLEHLSSVHVVQHGIDVNDNGKYDLAALGVSTFAKNLGVAGVPEEATNPASCGVVQGAGAAEAGAQRGRDRRCPSVLPECPSRCSRGCSPAAVVPGVRLFPRRPVRAASRQWPDDGPATRTLAGPLIRGGIEADVQFLPLASEPTGQGLDRRRTGHYRRRAGVGSAGKAVDSRLSPRWCAEWAQHAVDVSQRAQAHRRTTYSASGSRPTFGTRSRGWCCRSLTRWPCPYRGLVSDRRWSTLGSTRMERWRCHETLPSLAGSLEGPHRVHSGRPSSPGT